MPAIPLASSVAAYLLDLTTVCENANGRIVSLVLFGSAATGGYEERRSDVDLFIVVRDDVDAALRRILCDQVAKLEVVHGLAKSKSLQVDLQMGVFARALVALADRVTANARAFFICSRSDLLSGEPSRILNIPRAQALFLDRAAIPSILASARTVWGESLLVRVPLPPIRRLDVAKSFFGLFNQVLFIAAVYPLLPSATAYAMDALKRSVHNCYFCHHSRAETLAAEVAFFDERYGPDQTLQRLLVMRKQYRPSFRFVVSCLTALARLHRQTALNVRFPRPTR